MADDGNEKRIQTALADAAHAVDETKRELEAVHNFQHSQPSKGGPPTRSPLLLVVGR